VTLTTWTSFDPRTREKLGETKTLCTTCMGGGRATPAQRRRFAWEREMWCACPDSDLLGATCHSRHQTPWEWCVANDHYHCGKCRRIVQVG
jgi:hypothetical protein